MNMVDDLRKSVTDATPVYAVVGATELVVAKAREIGEKAREVGEVAAVQVRAQVGKARDDLDVTAVRAMAQQAPTRAVGKGLEVAARAEEVYGDLAERGAKLVERMKAHRGSHDLLGGSGATSSSGKSAVTTAGSPVAVEPTAVKPVPVKPAAVKPAAVKPAAVKPAAVKPAVKPAAVKPAVKPASVKPTTGAKKAAR
jgi:heparin binding hemagglutinin HbhA